MLADLPHQLVVDMDSLAGLSQVVVVLALIPELWRQKQVSF